MHSGFEKWVVLAVDVLYYIIFRSGEEDKNIIFLLILMWNVLSAVVDKWSSGQC